MAQGLTIKQEKFCQKYLECGNASEAYRFAYDCGGMAEKTIHESASKLLNNRKVAARLAELREVTSEALNISKERVLQALASIGFSKSSTDRNKISALDSISKMQGYNAPEKVANTDSQGNDLDRPLTPERKREILKEVGL